MMLGQSKMDITRVSLSLAILLCVASVVNAQDEASLAKSSAFYTTNFGQPIFTTSHSLTVGQRGPVLLEDFQTIEKLATLHRERIPPRVVHAKGAAAKGYFQVTKDITGITFADVFSAVGKKTDIIARFSLVTGPQGVPDWTRDPRGFALKFYTRQGNWDLVGNNFPVFFIRDGAQFPDLVHAAKASPLNNLAEAWRFADFLSFHPESMNIATYIFDDYGVPLNYRQMNGSSVNTYTLINKAGKVTLVKFQWKPASGEAYLPDSQLGNTATASPDGDFASADLFNSIQNNTFPEWYMYIQTMDPSAHYNLTFDPLDPTKVWPEAQFPLQEVGRIVLNENVANFFNENEQLAFSVAHVAPGIGYSDDKLLQSRLFAYDDAQRYRIGPNFALLPVNRPRCPFFNNQQDGPMNSADQKGEINYYPSSFAKQAPVSPYPYDDSAVSGMRVRVSINVTNDFEQPGNRYRYFDPARQQRFIARLSGFLSGPMVTKGIQGRWMTYLTAMDKGLGAAVAANLKTAAGSALENAPDSQEENLTARVPAPAPMTG